MQARTRCDVYTSICLCSALSWKRIDPSSSPREMGLSYGSEQSESRYWPRPQNSLPHLQILESCLNDYGFLKNEFKPYYRPSLVARSDLSQSKSRVPAPTCSAQFPNRIWLLQVPPTEALQERICNRLQQGQVSTKVCLLKKIQNVYICVQNEILHYLSSRCENCTIYQLFSSLGQGLCSLSRECSLSVFFLWFQWYSRGLGVALYEDDDV